VPSRRLSRRVGWCYFPSVRTEIMHIYTIFRPYRRKFTVKLRYFPSVRTENSELLQLISVKSSVLIHYFPSLWTENSKIRRLISVRTEIKRQVSLFSVRTNTDSADGAILLSKVLAQTN